ncbi:MAG: recombinase family protein, partial [Oscillospiraceae bacterium]|nr:recombinase family protein [Oscillospiraceae bacterium]
HVDKLLNYIRYWQSSGESIKTSIRTKTRMEQLTKEGLFIGGTAPFGYQLCKIGRMNKRGFEVHDILINYTEAAIVKLIYELYCNGKMGTFRIAQHLTTQGFFTRNGIPWSSATISNMLKNPVYTGIRKFGSTQSDILPHLQIIDTDIFRLAQRQVEKNKLIKPRPPRSVHAPTTLFADVLYCMQCEKRMTVTRNIKVQYNKNGSKSTYIRINYICINKSHIDICSGQKSFSVRKFDALFSEIMHSYLFPLNKNHLSVLNIDSDMYNEIEDLKNLLVHEKKTLDVLKREAVEAILGASAFLPVLVTDLIQDSKNKILGYEGRILCLSDTMRAQKAKLGRLHEVRKQLNSNNNLTFASLPLGSKQEIIEQLVERIHIARGYKYRIEWTFGGHLDGIMDI